MKSNVPNKFISYCRLTAILIFFLCEASAWAQFGNDFPTPVPMQPWINPQLPGLPPPPGNGSWESGAVPGSFQTLWGVRKGGKINFDVYVSGLGGSLYLGPVCSNCTNVRYLPPTDGSASPQEQWSHGSLGGWCLRCGWEATAGEDDPQIWLTYTIQQGSFVQAGIDWTGYTPPSPSIFNVLPDFTKEQYHAAGDYLNAVGAGASVAALRACARGSTSACGALGTTAAIASLASALLALVDPWDDAYGFPVEPRYPTAQEMGMEWLSEGSGDFFSDQVAYYNNRLIVEASYVQALLEAANVSINRANSCNQIDASCDQDRAAEAKWFLEAANSHAYDAALALYNLAYLYREYGYSQDPAGYEEIINAFDGVVDGFYWVSQVSVR